MLSKLFVTPPLRCRPSPDSASTTSPSTDSRSLLCPKFTRSVSRDPSRLKSLDRTGETQSARSVWAVDLMPASDNPCRGNKKRLISVVRSRLRSRKAVHIWENRDRLTVVLLRRSLHRRRQICWILVHRNRLPLLLLCTLLLQQTRNRSLACQATTVPQQHTVQEHQAAPRTPRTRLHRHRQQVERWYLL